MCVYILVYVCMYIYMYILVYIYIYNYIYEYLYMIQDDGPFWGSDHPGSASTLTKPASQTPRCRVFKNVVVCWELVLHGCPQRSTGGLKLGIPTWNYPLVMSK